jgi:hypothetical protein
MKIARNKKRDLKHLYSNKVFRANYAEWKRSEHFDYLLETRDAISSYYSNSKRHGKTRNELLDNLTTVEFTVNHSFPFDLSIIAGAVSGLMIWLISYAIKELSTFSTGSSIVNIIAYFILELVLAAVFAVLMVLIIRQAYSTLERQHDNFYRLYILPYEKQLIIKTLREEYNFLVDDNEITQSLTS